MTVLYPEPVPGIPIVEPEIIPHPNEILVGYEVVRPHKLGFLTKPRPKRMNIVGWVAVAAATVLFFPVMCVPCCMSCSYSPYQRPVYRPAPIFGAAAKSGEVVVAQEAAPAPAAEN